MPPEVAGQTTSLQDLSGAKVDTVTGSSATGYLTAHAITFTGLPTINDAYQQLDSGAADAIVFDAPVLQNHIKLTRSAHDTLVGGIFAHENYGIALPTGSALRKKINETLLDITEDGTHDQLYSKYFGDANPPDVQPPTEPRHRCLNLFATNGDLTPRLRDPWPRSVSASSERTPT